MSVLVQDSDFTLHVGDVRDVLRELEPESVHCVVTSPPYWGLRDYGTGQWEGGDAECDHKQTKLPKPPERYTAGGDYVFDPGGRLYQDTCGKCGATRIDQQLGLEPTPEEYVANMVEVFREVRRVLRADGTCWVNLGDSYAAAGGHTGQGESSQRKGRSNVAEQNRGTTVIPPGLKPKDLIGIPWRVAFALQADGWYLRSDIVWSKLNPMPESVTDRPTKAHEYIFLLTKSPRYFFDQEAVRELHTDSNGSRILARQKHPGERGARVERPDPHRVHEQHYGLLGVGTMADAFNPAGRNIRSVWNIATEPYPEAHFATFPQALVEPCIKAGTSERGCCPECGAPWVRVVERPKSPFEDTRIAGDGARPVRRQGTSETKLSGAKMQAWLDANPAQTLGWRLPCDCAECDEADPTPSVVLDPFLGSGTTALVARRLGRRCIGVELSPEYAELAARRLNQLSLLA